MIFTFEVKPFQYNEYMICFPHMFRISQVGNSLVPGGAMFMLNNCYPSGNTSAEEIGDVLHL